MDIVEELRDNATQPCPCVQCRGAAEIDRLRAYIWMLDGKTVCSRIDGDKFIDEGMIVASDICPLPSPVSSSADGSKT